MSEETFWRNYFYRISLLKHSLELSAAQNQGMHVIWRVFQGVVLHDVSFLSVTIATFRTVMVDPLVCCALAVETRSDSQPTTVISHVRYD